MAFPIGGVGNTDIIVLEMHYDNPNGDVGKFLVLHSGKHASDSTSLSLI